MAVGEHAPLGQGQEGLLAQRDDQVLRRDRRLQHVGHLLVHALRLGHRTLPLALVVLPSLPRPPDIQVRRSGVRPRPTEPPPGSQESPVNGCRDNPPLFVLGVRTAPVAVLIVGIVLRVLLQPPIPRNVVGVMRVVLGLPPLLALTGHQLVQGNVVVGEETLAPLAFLEPCRRTVSTCQARTRRSAQAKECARVSGPQS